MNFMSHHTLLIVVELYRNKMQQNQKLRASLLASLTAVSWKEKKKTPRH